MNLKLVLPLVVALSCGNACASRCEAQWSFNFGYSEGYRGHYHPGHWHGHYGYNWWYRPYVDYVYVAPPPVPTVYVPMATTTMPAAQPNLPAGPAMSSFTPSTAAGASSTTSLRSNPLPAYQGSGITIRNPANSGGRVAFVVDEKLELDLAPGESTPLKEKASYTVEFDRGGDFGTSRRVLGEGVYEFVAAENGWDLRREPLPGAVNANSTTSPTVRRNALPTTTR